MRNIFIVKETNYVFDYNSGSIIKFEPILKPFKLTKQGIWEYDPSFVKLLTNAVYSVLNPVDFVNKNGKTEYVGKHAVAYTGGGISMFYDKQTFIEGGINYLMFEGGLIYKFDSNKLPYALLLDGTWEFSPSAKRRLYDAQYSFAVLDPRDMIDDGRTAKYTGSITDADISGFSTGTSIENLIESTAFTQLIERRFSCDL